MRRLYLIYDLLQFRVDPPILLVFGPYFSTFSSFLVSFWSIFGQLDPSSDPILRVSSLFHFSNAGRRASVTLDVLNTVRTFEVRPGDDASWSLGLLRQAAFQDVVGALFLTAFWPNLLRFFTEWHQQSRPEP